VDVVAWASSLLAKEIESIIKGQTGGRP